MFNRPSLNGGGNQKKTMKKLMLYFGVVVTLLMSVVACTKSEAEECQLEHAATVAPTLELTAAEVTCESLSFTLNPTDAASLRYCVVEASDVTPTAENLFDKSSSFYGTPADAAMADTYTVAGLALGTEYTVYAAAKNNIGLSELKSLTLTTLIPEAKLVIEVNNIKSNAFTLKVTTENVGKASVLVGSQNAEFDAEFVFEEGDEIVCEDGVVEYTIKGLTPSTDYAVYVAATDLTMGNAQVVTQNFTTLEQPAPKVGDYYYADGTWSSELDAKANPIGVIFYLGKHETDTTAYTTKEGVALEEFHGYVVAAFDATYDPLTGVNTSVVWSFYDSWADPTRGVSNSQQDFLGYANSQAIKAAAPNQTLEDNDDDNYPAFYYAMVKHEENFAAPDASSGWFIPSAAQLKYIWDTFNPESATDALIDNKLAALAEEGLGAKMYTTDATYWTSTERVSSGSSYQAFYANFDYSNFNPGFVSYDRKDYKNRVRPMLAF